MTKSVHTEIMEGDLCFHIKVDDNIIVYGEYELSPKNPEEGTFCLSMEVDGKDNTLGYSTKLQHYEITGNYTYKNVVDLVQAHIKEANEVI